MKIFRRVLLAFIILLVLAIAGGWIFINQIKTRAIPDYAENVDLENLTGKVTVIRDSLAIPHIYAENEEDLYRVTGYITAQDRLWQMDLMRRITLGRLSEIFGEDMITADQLFRAFNFTKKSEKVISRTDPEIIKCLEAFADGVNQYIETHEKKLSFEFALLGYKPDKWTIVHTTNLIGYMAWDLTSGWDEDIALYKISQVVDDSLVDELLPGGIGNRATFVYPEFLEENPELAMNTMVEQTIDKIKGMGINVFEASNNWAVSGSHTESGKPLLANDMHLGFMSPGIWYQVHQVVEGKLDVTGVLLPGQPYVIVGHNQDIAWGMTNLTVDNMDFYLETINPADSNQYKLNGRWIDMRTVEEEINVKGWDEPVYRINRFTHRGPVVSTFRGVKDKVLSARWIGMDYSNELRTVHLFNRAANWEEFRDAARTFISISQNIIYADKEGNIGLQASGGVPVRKVPPAFIYPGDSTLYDWGENDKVPFEELPFSYNPENGMVSSANNKTVDDTYPYYIATWYSLPNRIDRIREMLHETDKHSTQSFSDMQSDQLSVFARRMVPVYLEALEGNVNGIAAEALQKLENWDYRMGPDKASPLIFEQLYYELIKVIFKDELGPEVFESIVKNNIIPRYHIYYLADAKSSKWCDDVTTANKKERFADNIQAAFSAAIDTLVALAGENVDNWRYGDFHQLSINHPMGGVSIVQKLFDPNLGPFAVGGSFHTVSPFTGNTGEEFSINWGSSQRHIYDLNNWDHSKTVIPTGTSGVPASPYYGNQTDMYMNYRYHADPFSKPVVESKMKYKAVFE